MSKIIITRHVNGGLTAVVYSNNGDDPNDPIMEFESYTEALTVAATNPICIAWGYEIVDVNLPER